MIEYATNHLNLATAAHHTDLIETYRRDIPEAALRRDSRRRKNCVG